MRIVKPMGLVLVAVCALCALAVSSASASLFLAHPTGKLLSKALQNQKFQTPAGLITCTALSLFNSSAVALRALTQVVTVEYEKCEGFGLKLKVSLAEYEFSADNGLVRVLKDITVTGLSCTVTVPAAKNQSLQTIKYLNIGNEIIIEPAVTGITSVGVGTACAYAEGNTIGNYEGNSLLAVENGTVRWEQQ